MKKVSFWISCSICLLTACSPMNTDFSCKVTAGDSCLTIEEVDAKTSFADDVHIPRKRMNTKLPHHAYYLTSNQPQNDKQLQNRIEGKDERINA